MEEIKCATCGKQLTYRQITVSLWNNRRPKYCSTHCWGKRERFHNYDHTFMDTDTELAAYWAGFWTADGHIASADKGVSITTVDEQLLNDFMDRINYKNAVYVRQPKSPTHKVQYAIRLYGNVSQRIQEMGYVPGAKGGKEFFPARFYNEQFFFHFLRGFYDGDGSVHGCKNGSLTLYVCNMSKKLLEDIHSWLYTRKIIRGGAVYETKPAFYKLQFGHFDTVQICQRMYENATIKLDRKYQIYLAGKDFVQGAEPQTNLMCSVPGCPYGSRSSGLCKQHYDAKYWVGYCAEHKEQIAEKNKLWKLANIDHVNELRREHYAADPEKHRESSKQWKEEHKDQVKDYKQVYNATHREEINAYKRQYRVENHEAVRAQEKRAYESSKDSKLARAREYKKEHKAQIDAANAAYRDKTKDDRKDYDKARYAAKKDVIKAQRRSRYQAAKSA